LNKILTLVDEGKATAYNPEIMDRVVANRLKWRHLKQEQVDGALGFVALQGNYIGKSVLMELPTGELVGPFLVADCGAGKDQAWLDKINFAIDLSYELALKYLPSPRIPLHGVKVWLISDGNDGVAALVNEGVRPYEEVRRELGLSDGEDD